MRAAPDGVTEAHKSLRQEADGVRLSVLLDRLHKLTDDSVVGGCRRWVRPLLHLGVFGFVWHGNSHVRARLVLRDAARDAADFNFRYWWIAAGRVLYHERSLDGALRHPFAPHRAGQRC